MAKNKTVETDESVMGFLDAVDDATKRADCLLVLEMMQAATGLAPKMWGPAIVGFGSYHYKYESGREGDAPRVAFSPRKNAISLYLSANFKDREVFLKRFGKHMAGKSCINVKRLSDVDLEVLQEMVKRSFIHSKEIYPVD